MKINYYPERLQPRSIRSFYLGSYLLVQGLNELPNNYRDRSDVQKLIANKTIELVEDAQEADTVVETPKVTSRKAKTAATKETTVEEV